MALAALYVGSIFFLGWLDDYYYRTRPRQPDQASGRVFPEDVKGTVGVARVYLTRTEIFPFRYAEFFLIGFFAAAGVTRVSLENPRECSRKYAEETVLSRTPTDLTNRTSGNFSLDIFVRTEI
jgi:hypothetical protein